MHNFFLLPIHALFDGSLYREAVRTWRTKKAFLFLLYLIVFYVIGTMLGLFRMSSKLTSAFGKLNESHPIMRFLKAVPHQWSLGADGVSLSADDGTPVEKWSFENWLYADTTQNGDFNAPGDYFFVMSRALLWSPQERGGRAVRFREWYDRAGQETKLYIYRDLDGNFDHFEIVGRDGKPRLITKADLASGLRFTKIVVLSVAFIFSWFAWFFVKCVAILILTFFAWLLNFAAKRGLTFRQLFNLSLLIQSPVLIAHLLSMFVPNLARFGMLMSWTVSIVYLGIVFFRFLSEPAISEESSRPAGI